MQLRRELQRRGREVIVAQRVLNGSPQRKVAWQLLRIEIERQQDLSSRSLRRSRRVWIYPVRYRVSDRQANERWPIRLGRIRQQTIHVGGKPVRLPRVIERRTKLRLNRAILSVHQRSRLAIGECRLNGA